MSVAHPAARQVQTVVVRQVTNLIYFSLRSLPATTELRAEPHTSAPAPCKGYHGHLPCWPKYLAVVFPWHSVKIFRILYYVLDDFNLLIV